MRAKPLAVETFGSYNRLLGICSGGPLAAASQRKVRPGLPGDLSPLEESVGCERLRQLERPRKGAEAKVRRRVVSADNDSGGQRAGPLT